MPAPVLAFKGQLRLLPLSWSPELPREKFDTLRQTCCEEVHAHHMDTPGEKREMEEDAGSAFNCFRPQLCEAP